MLEFLRLMDYKHIFMAWKHWLYKPFWKVIEPLILVEWVRIQAGLLQKDMALCLDSTVDTSGPSTYLNVFPQLDIVEKTGRQP